MLQEIEREEALATELARAKLAQMSEEKMRQQVRESSIELRELEQKLKEGWVLTWHTFISLSVVFLAFHDFA